MQKDTYYFKHDCNARHDTKILKLRRKYKLEGYGIYFCLIEILREQSGYKLKLSDIPDVAFDLQISEEMLTSIVNDFGLFSVEKDAIFSPSLMRRMKEFDAQKAARIEAGRKGGKAKGKQKPSDAKAKLEQRLSEAQALYYTILKETTQEDMKLDDILEILFERFWLTYDKPVDKKKSFEKFCKLPKDEMELLFQYVGMYVESTPDKQFRKNPLTYINGKCWKDMIGQTPTKKPYVPIPDNNW